MPSPRSILRTLHRTTAALAFAAAFAVIVSTPLVPAAMAGTPGDMPESGKSRATDPQATEPDAMDDTDVAPSEGMPEPIRQDLSYKVPAGMPIEVDNPYGDIRVRFGGYEHSFDMHTTLQQPEGAAKIAFAPGVRDGRFLVAPRLPEGGALAQGQRLDLVLYLPQGHALVAKTLSGKIESRSVKSDINLRSESGEIAVRGTEGAVQVETSDGEVIVQMAGAAKPGSTQRIATRTGAIVLEVEDAVNAEVRMATSHQFATDYSLEIERRDGEEPNKRARALVGTPATGADRAVIVVESLVGEVRLHRRAVFIDPQ